MSRKPRVISLFTGAGGIDYGFEAAGYKTAVAVELDPWCCETLRRNRKWPVLEADIFGVGTDDILGGGRLERGEVDLVVGGPPCQPFSKSGYWASGDSRRLDDPRANTLSAYLRVVEEALPRAFLLENVYGIAYSGKNEGLDFLLQQIRKINRRTGARYEPTYTILKAADFGVPQIRERFFLVAQRDGQRFEFPRPTHRPKDEAQLELYEGLPSYRTAWDAIGDLPEPTEDLAMRGKWAGLLPSVPEGENYLWHTDRGGGLPLFGWRRRFWTFLLKLAKDRPSWTLQAQPGPAVGPFHWKSRRLSTRELLRLQTFPDDLKIAGNRGAVQRQLGNAVPSLLAEVLAREIKTQLLGFGRPRAQPRLLPPDRSPAPPPEPLRPVPEEYRHLIGEHEAHPGTGKGYAAERRDSSSSAHEAPAAEYANA